METNREIDARELYSVRMIVLMEQEPQSNKYCQVVFSKDQYKKLTEVVDGMFPRCKDCNGAEILLNEGSITLPDLHEVDDEDR